MRVAACRAHHVDVGEQLAPFARGVGDPLAVGRPHDRALGEEWRAIEWRMRDDAIEWQIALSGFRIGDYDVQLVATANVCERFSIGRPDGRDIVLAADDVSFRSS